MKSIVLFALAFTLSVTCAMAQLDNVNTSRNYRALIMERDPTCFVPSLRQGPTKKKDSDGAQGQPESTDEYFSCRSTFLEEYLSRIESVPIVANDAGSNPKLAPSIPTPAAVKAVSPKQSPATSVVRTLVQPKKATSK